MPKPVDLEFDAAIVEMAASALPDGFDVADEAPRTFAELNARLNAGRRMIVWSGGSEKTIYGDPSVNYAFRAWHDWCHWRGRHDFTFAGEVAVCDMQCRQLIERYGASRRTSQWCAILRAEIVGQAVYFERHGRFPNDQNAFVRWYLENPITALGGQLG